MRPLPEIEGDTARESVRGIAGGEGERTGDGRMFGGNTRFLSAFFGEINFRVLVKLSSILRILFTLSWASHEVSESGDEELCGALSDGAFMNCV